MHGTRITVIAALALTLVTAVAHGVVTARWTGGRDSAPRMPDVPNTIGDWVGSNDDTEIDDRDLAHLTRKYTHARTGSVSIGHSNLISSTPKPSIWPGSHSKGGTVLSGLMIRIGAATRSTLIVPWKQSWISGICLITSGHCFAKAPPAALILVAESVPRTETLGIASVLGMTVCPNRTTR